MTAGLPGPSSLSVCIHFQMAALLPPDRAQIFLLLMSMPDHSFALGDVLEAVQLNRDFPSALRFLCHSCPICQEQVSFSQVSDWSRLLLVTTSRPLWSHPLFVLSVDHHHDSLLLLPVSNLF